MLLRRTNHTMQITVNTKLFLTDATTTAPGCALDGRCAR
jgi:hypothetical protein